MICYKITNHAKGSLLASDFSVNYSQYHWVRGTGKLFVFDSMRSIDNFRATIHPICSVRWYPVWKCTVKNPEILAIMAKYTDEYERFWESFPHIPADLDVEETPAGTLAVSTLKLLERVC